MPAQKPCKGGKDRPGCGQSIILVPVASGGVVVLDPYPLEPGHHTPQAVPVGFERAGGGRTSARVLSRAEADRSGVKWYERHRCITTRNAVPAPHRRPEQLGLL
jgi:hypothetical protein